MSFRSIGDKMRAVTRFYGGKIMGKYTEDSKELLKLVGGKENIAAVSHCMTRMRFVLADPKKAVCQKD